MVARSYRDSPLSSLVSSQGATSPPLLNGCGRELNGPSLYKDQGRVSGVRRTTRGIPRHQPHAAMMGVFPRSPEGPEALAHFKTTMSTYSRNTCTHKPAKPHAEPQTYSPSEGVGVSSPKNEGMFNHAFPLHKGKACVRHVVGRIRHDAARVCRRTETRPPETRRTWRAR